MSATILCPAVYTSDQGNKARMCGRNSNYIVSHYLSVLSLLKSETTWLHRDELQFRAEKYFLSIHIAKPSKWSQQMEMFACFLHCPDYIKIIQSQCCRTSSNLTCHRSLQSWFPHVPSSASLVWWRHGPECGHQLVSWGQLGNYMKYIKQVMTEIKMEQFRCVRSR